MILTTKQLQNIIVEELTQVIHEKETGEFEGDADSPLQDKYAAILNAAADLQDEGTKNPLRQAFINQWKADVAHHKEINADAKAYKTLGGEFKQIADLYVAAKTADHGGGFLGLRNLSPDHRGTKKKALRDIGLAKRPGEKPSTKAFTHKAKFLARQTKDLGKIATDPSREYTLEPTPGPDPTPLGAASRVAADDDNEYRAMATALTSTDPTEEP